MNYFGGVNTEWRSEFAYALGLLVTDGCLSKDGRHFDFTSKDRELVEIFSKCLDLNVKIGKKSRSFESEKKYFRVQFGDVNFYKWCLDFGLTPNKSKILKEVKIPDKYFFDFLRGCFDGDGGMYAYWDPRWESSYMFYLQFTSASPIFLMWLKNNINRLVKVEGKISEGMGAQRLRYAKRGTYIIFNKMFHSKDIPYLERKFIKAQKIFSIDIGHNNAQVEK